jgi:hypothetical protein
MSFRKAQWIAWPSFLMAGVLEMLVFSVADPDELRGFGGAFNELSPSAIYTLAFFCFWVIVALASSLTLLLSSPEPEVPPPSKRWP